MFEEWYLNDLISPTIQKIWKQTDYYLFGLIKQLFDRTGIWNLLKTPVTAEEIHNRLNYKPETINALKWMLKRLELEGYLTSQQGRYSQSGKTPDFNLENVKKEAVSQAADSEAAFNMLKMMADQYEEYFSGKKTGVDILFSPDSIEITNSYYSRNLFYNVHNIAGAKIINYLIEGKSNPVIVEFGGGLGGGTKQFLMQRVQDKKPVNQFKYIFTDVANKMLRSTRKDLLQITEDLSGFEFSKYDFNQPIESSGFEPGSVDLIWGVNAAHVAVDLKFTLNEFKRILKPGGSLVITETVRPIGNQMIQQEFILNTLHDYWNVKLDPDVRPEHGFMDWHVWVKALQATGFKNVESMPDLSILEKKYNNCYVAVIRGVNA